MFALKADGRPLSEFEFTDPGFKLVDEKVAIFDGVIGVGEKMINYGTFEWRPATLSHKIVEQLDDDPITDIKMAYIKNSAAITSEALNVLSRHIDPEKGLTALLISDMYKMDERLSDTVVEQFALHCKNLEELTLEGSDRDKLPASDRPNLVDFFARILEEQKDDKMKKLKTSGICNEVSTELTEEDKRFIEALVKSGQTKLDEINLRNDAVFWNNEEAAGYLLEFIEDQTCLTDLSLEKNKFTSAMTAQVLQTLLRAPCLKTLCCFMPGYSADFSSDEACEALCQFID